jgi:hypothetical protein
MCCRSPKLRRSWESLRPSFRGGVVQLATSSLNLHRQAGAPAPPCTRERTNTFIRAVMTACGFCHPPRQRLPTILQARRQPVSVIRRWCRPGPVWSRIVWSRSPCGDSLTVGNSQCHIMCHVSYRHLWSTGPLHDVGRGKAVATGSSGV